LEKTITRTSGTLRSFADVPSGEQQWQLEYQGVVSVAIRSLKLVSITTAVLSLIGSPAYLYYTLDSGYTAVKVLAASGFTCFGLFTTGAACLLREQFTAEHAERL
jgi:hypothetical protein